MVCKYCGSSIKEDDLFCLKCGKRIERLTENQNCIDDSEDANSDITFCAQNENNNQTDSKKKIIKRLSLFAIAAIFVVICICVYLRFSSQTEQEQQKMIYSYQVKSKELYDEMKESESNFYVIQTMFNLSVKMNAGLLGPSDFVEYSKSLCSSEIAEEASRKRKIDNMYSDLNEMECDASEISELKNAVRNCYSAYEARCDLLVECNFSISLFSGLADSTDKDFEEASSILNDLLSEIDFTKELDEDSAQQNKNNEVTSL